MCSFFFVHLSVIISLQTQTLFPCCIYICVTLPQRNNQTISHSFKQITSLFLLLPMSALTQMTNELVHQVLIFTCLMSLLSKTVVIFEHASFVTVFLFKCIVFKLLKFLLQSVLPPQLLFLILEEQDHYNKSHLCCVFIFVRLLQSFGICKMLFFVTVRFFCSYYEAAFKARSELILFTPYVAAQITVSLFFRLLV